MAFLDGIGLSDLIQKIKSAFIEKANTQTVTAVDIDSSPTIQSTHLIESGGVYSAINPPIETIQPLNGFLPGVIYDLGELSENTTFALATPTDNTIPNAYHWTFDTGSTAPTITWPSGVIWPEDFTPSVDADKHYEVFVRNGYISILTFSLS